MIFTLEGKNAIYDLGTIASGSISDSGKAFSVTVPSIIPNLLDLMKRGYSVQVKAKVPNSNDFTDVVMEAMMYSYVKSPESHTITFSNGGKLAGTTFTWKKIDEVQIATQIPAPPSANGTYNLQAVKNNSGVTYSWHSTT